MKIKPGSSASEVAARTIAPNKMTSLKAAASRVQLKGTSASRWYLLIDQTAVMDCGFSRRSRRETARCCRSHVGCPAAICDWVGFAIEASRSFHEKSVSSRAAKSKPILQPPEVTPLPTRFVREVGLVHEPLPTTTPGQQPSAPTASKPSEPALVTNRQLFRYCSSLTLSCRLSSLSPNSVLSRPLFDRGTSLPDPHPCTSVQ